MANYTSITLGELLSSDNETIKRHAVGILKQLQKMKAFVWNVAINEKGKWVEIPEDEE